jgi:hypothetical protein
MTISWGWTRLGSCRPPYDIFKFFNLNEFLMLACRTDRRQRAFGQVV